MGDGLDNHTIAKAYARWAPVYDLVFGAVFERGRQAAIIAAERIGGRILEVGVGTGISLPDYARTSRIVGVEPQAVGRRQRRTRRPARCCSFAERPIKADRHRFPLFSALGNRIGKWETSLGNALRLFT